MTTHDPEAERALLGACILDPSQIDAALPIVTAGDFYSPGHQAIFDALTTAWLAGERPDPVALSRRITATSVPLDYLHELLNATYSVSLTARYATLVAEARVRRRLVLAGADIVALGNGEAGSDDATDAVERARALLADIDMPTVGGPPAPTARDFVASVDDRHDWLFPQFLEHGDRLLITSAEGAGKSVLLTQIAVMAAAGIHPWTWHRQEPVNVTLVDLENGSRMIARRLARLLRHAGPTFDDARLRVESRQRGVNITSPVDRRWLLDRCTANGTDLLVIGPAYRLSSGVASRGDVGGEDQAKTVTDALDDIRDRCGVTLIMETHAPHAGPNGRDLRPFGSSVWLRWPEFGIGLRKDKGHDRRFTVEHWRGARDVRTWPLALEQHGVTWPWVPIMPPSAVPHPADTHDDAHLFGGPA